jgi:phage shock protein PspC (stress-responsive transcriptional regulator)
MFCTQCGVSLGEQGSNFCPGCGKSTRGEQQGQYQATKKILYRPRYGGRIAGVCAGLANYLDVDVTLVRILAAIAFFCYGTGFLAYIIAIFVMPNEEDLAPVQAPYRP